MSITPNLVFFNKEGYPYNFRLNDGIWTGKIFFDPGSTDIFKSISLYTLESVGEIEYSSSFDIVNKEIYNNSGITLSKGGYTNEIVTDILTVNQSEYFYTKWIYGNNFNTYFPKGTIISFGGNAQSGVTTGESDFSGELDYYFTVLQTASNSIMISTTTNNKDFSFIFDSDIHDFTISSYYCISVLDSYQDLVTDFNISTDEEVSVVGSLSGVNDGVYEVSGVSYTESRIFDYDLSGVTGYTFGDFIHADLTLLTERPILYNGQIDVFSSSGTLYVTFLGGRNSNITVGTNFICEDNSWNHLLGGNEYVVNSIVTENYLCTPTGMTFSGVSYEQDDGVIAYKHLLRMEDTFGIDKDLSIRFDSGVTSHLNNNLIKKVTDIVSGVTYVDELPIVHYDIYLDSFVSYESGATYSIVNVLKPHEQNTVIVTPSIDNSIYEGYARVLSTTNQIRYSQEIPNNSGVISGSTIDALDIFINKFRNVFEFNGIDIYRKEQTLLFEGRYGGQNPYFDMDLYINSNPIDITEGYSVVGESGKTYIYNILLKDCDLVYERLNMSNDLSQSYYADITLDLFDDSQDYGFQLSVNGIQYYISFNNDSGTTSYTLETINSFIDKYHDVFYYNGIDISSGTTSGGTINHLYVSGQEPNIDIWEMKVKVNRNSSYTLTETQDKFMMVTANKITNPSNNFIDIGFSTGMILSVSGSTYPLNNKEFNVIGISSDTVELSYQGPMYSESGVTLNLKTREFLRRPRETNDSDIIYRYRWEDDTNSTMFLYDLSGDNLVAWGNNSNYEYIGVKPLSYNGDFVFLNKEPNKSIDYISTPYKQQTIFDELDFTLQRFDDDNASILPNPIQTFIGYNSKIEGVDQRNLIVERVDNVNYIGTTSNTSLYFSINGYTITMVNRTESFLDLGFKTGRYIRIKFDDNKLYTQEIFEDYSDYLVTEVTNTTIKVDQVLTTFTTENEDFNFEFILLPERIAIFGIFGETEDEDERLEANLKLLGISLTEEDEYIFKQSEVTEDGIDYRLLNRKRKEMMSVFPDIYNYVGSYRAILNSINFFGYSDVELVEYYRNIDKNSPYYKKLKRSVIPDLLDRQVEGWSYSESIPSSLEYVKTNLLNLTYRITDEEGNNVYLYTLKEVQVKLNGLKNWLRRNVIPVNSNVRDITGVSESTSTNWRRFDPGTNFTKNVTSHTNEAVNVNYTSTKSFNDSWLVSLRFYTISGDIPLYWDLKIITFKKDPITGLLYPQQRWDDLRVDLTNFNFSINWEDYDYDRFFCVQTTRYNDYGVAKSVNKMYRLEDGATFYFDEFKNYTLVNNNFKYKTFGYVQNLTDVYIMDGEGNFWIINKEVQANRI